MAQSRKSTATSSKTRPGATVRVWKYTAVNSGDTNALGHVMAEFDGEGDERVRRRRVLHRQEYDQGFLGRAGQGVWFCVYVYLRASMPIR